MYEKSSLHGMKSSLYKDGKPVNFVYNKEAGCDIANRLVDASEWRMTLMELVDMENVLL
jgi:hypothetical protein